MLVLWLELSDCALWVTVLQDQVDRAGLPRTVRWGVSAAILVGLVWFANFSTALIGSFVICTYWRTLMFTREVRMVVHQIIKCCILQPSSTS